MKKDIFIDNNIACRFSNPMDPEMKKLILWLMAYDEKRNDNAILVVSDKLLHEYFASCQNAASASSIPMIVNQMVKEGRLVKISNEEIKTFKNKYFTKAVVKKLHSNNEDRNHIPVVCLSERKYALTRDDKFTEDLKNFPGFKVLVCSKPQDMPYNV